MSTVLNPYLGFRDNARQAMEFYLSVFGGELTLSTFGEFQASEDPAEQGKIIRCGWPSSTPRSAVESGPGDIQAL